VTAVRHSSELTAALNDVLGADIQRPVALHEPEITDEEERLVGDCLKSGWVSSVGSYVGQFESELCSFTNAKYAVAMASGTSALQLALHAIGVANGDEVIIPALSFVATANAVSHCGAIPHFVDSTESDLGVDAQHLRRYLSAITQHRDGATINRLTGRRLSAVVPVHVLGLAASIDEISSVAREFGLPVVEDAAEAVGTTIGSRHAGTFGVAGMLSFNGNKIITTGNGGAILTDDEALAQRLRHISSTAKKAHAWRFDHDEIGWNYRLPNLNAALGCAQLRRLNSLLERKRLLHERYQARLAGNNSLKLLGQRQGTTSNYWLNAVSIPGLSFEEREQVLGDCHAQGFLCRPMWTLLSNLPMYQSSPRSSLETAHRIERETVCLPSGPRLTR
jgi:perosamine synthetase